MLTTIQESVIVGSDGLIKLHARGFGPNTKLSVVAVIETEETYMEDDWKSFLAETAGALCNTPIAKPSEIDFEQREKLS